MLATGPFKEILSSDSEAWGPDEWYNSAWVHILPDLCSRSRRVLNEGRHYADSQRLAFPHSFGLLQKHVH